jgi:hypothetical protein
LELGSWDLGFGPWDLELGSWDLGFGPCDLELGSWDFKKKLPRTSDNYGFNDYAAPKGTAAQKDKMEFV